MARIKITGLFGTAKKTEKEPKIKDVPIELLRITPDTEGTWLRHWIQENGDRVKESPQYLYLVGDYEPIWEWCRFQNLPTYYFSQKIMEVLKSLIYEGQKEPIKIYRDMRINTGHKRAACMLYLGAKFIKAEIVPDNYKL